MKQRVLVESPQVFRWRRGFLSILAHLPDLWRNWSDKEWWYSGLIDARQRFYLSWYFFRAHLCDHFAITLFDLERGDRCHLARNLLLDRPQQETGLALQYQNDGLQLEYSGASEQGWRFQLAASGWRVNLQIVPQTPPFSKFDNTMVMHYGLVHHFHNAGRGSIELADRRYNFQGALGYYDHCFGRVPRRSAWHWLAVQNRHAALASLVNYGPYGQCYSQIYLRAPLRAARRNQWVRLEQSVSFENLERRDGGKCWRLSSADLDLELQLGLSLHSETRLPPLIPLLVRLQRRESVVRVRGRVRIDGRWLDPGEMFGVIEEHAGRW